MDTSDLKVLQIAMASFKKEYRGLLDEVEAQFLKKIHHLLVRAKDPVSPTPRQREWVMRLGEKMGLGQKAESLERFDENNLGKAKGLSKKTRPKRGPHNNSQKKQAKGTNTPVSPSEQERRAKENAERLQWRIEKKRTEIVKLHQEGLNPDQIAKKVKITKKAIRAWIRTNL